MVKYIIVSCFSLRILFSQVPLDGHYIRNLLWKNIVAGARKIRPDYAWYNFLNLAHSIWKIRGYRFWTILMDGTQNRRIGFTIKPLGPRVEWYCTKLLILCPHLMIHPVSVLSYLYCVIATEYKSPVWMQLSYNSLCYARWQSSLHSFQRNFTNTKLYRLMHVSQVNICQ